MAPWPAPPGSYGSGKVTAISLSCSASCKPDSMTRLRTSSSPACDRARTVTETFSRHESRQPGRRTSNLYPDNRLNRLRRYPGELRHYTGVEHALAISAHGPRAGTIEAYAHALETGAEYVEFDIRRTADGELAAFHDARTRQGEALAAISYARLCELAGYQVPRVADVMALIAGKAIGHLDLKDTGGEEQVVEMALDILGPGNFVVTTLEDAIGGRDQGAVPRGARRAVAGPRPGRGAAVQAGGDPARASSGPMRRLRACRADWVAVNHRLAAGGGAGAVPPGRNQDDDLDGRRGRGDTALAHRPAGHRADHQPARRRGGAARGSHASCISRSVNECGGR